MAGQRAGGVPPADRVSEAARMLIEDAKKARVRLEASRILNRPVDPEPLARVMQALGFLVEEIFGDGRFKWPPVSRGTNKTLDDIEITPTMITAGSRILERLIPDGEDDYMLEDLAREVYEVMYSVSPDK